MFFIRKTELSNEDKEKIIEDVLHLYKINDWCFDYPPYQTWPTLFEKTDSHWMNLKKSFTNAVGSIVDLSVFYTRCWAYTNIPNIKVENEDLLWHQHKSPNKDFDKVLSACFYLSLPEGSFTTEYIIDNEIKNMPYEENSWTVFPGNLQHRPGKWDAQKMNVHRIVLAADCYFK